MKGVIKFLLMGSLLVVSFILLTSCSQNEQKQENTEKLGKMVKSMVIGDDKAVRYRSFPGRVDAIKKVDLAFQVSGPLIEFPVINGQEVNKGQLLAKIDPRDYKLAVDEEQAKYEKAERDEQRYSQLVEKGAVAKIDYDEKKAQRDISAARYETAKKALNDTIMVAPFKGIVAKTFVDNHENVSAKQKILSLQDISSIEIVIDVSENDVFRSGKKNLKTGEASPVVAYATFESLPGKKFDLRLKEYSTEADPNTQTYQIKLFMPTPSGLNVFPGMTATVLAGSTQGNNQIYEIPLTAIAADEKDQSYVWLIDTKTMTVKKQNVNLGSMHKDSIEVISGLHPGDRIVTAGAALLHPDEKVRLLEESKDWKVKQ